MYTLKSSVFFPQLHLPCNAIPLVHRPSANVIIVIVLRAIPRHRLAKCDVYPSSVFHVLASPLRYRMQPIGLRLAPHKHHIARSEGKLDAFARNCLVLEQEVPLRTKRKRGDPRIWPEEAFVVAVIRNTVGSVGVIVYQTKVERAASGSLGAAAESGQARRDGTRLDSRVASIFHLSAIGFVYYVPIVVEA